ncbi:MAG TPA: histidine kinase dimerization/phospho-acceptor domain-containing protein [Sphingomicrobium sp.]|nr:histidine kinase dimerization/phospho-acceptor domain-containing protein [Sphingomicrobium sp.]
MRFDDRLTTVLAQPAEDAHDRAVRWRQLVELLARGRGSLETEAARQALAEVRDHAPTVAEPVRAAAARAVAGLPLPKELISIFASDDLTVAAPVLAAASLTEDEWREVHAGAGADVQSFIANLQPGLAAGDEPKKAPKPEASPPPSPGLPPGNQAIPSISDLVARIERLRRTRQPGRAAGEDERGKPGDASTLQFRWEALPSGEIGWVDGAPRGAIIGRSLASAAEDGFDARIERAFALRAPFREAPLVIAREGALAGEWRVSGVPAFEPADGRFAGYRGIAVRSEASRPTPVSPETDELPDHDSVRELVHEIKTPLNAIMGFAEIIERQYLGPADHRYRARAAEIIAQARILLEAIDDLDYAAKLQAPGAEPAATADIAAVVTGLSAEVEAFAQAKGITIQFDLAGGDGCSINHELGRRLLRRFCLALADSAGARESFTVAVRSEDGRCSAYSDLPGKLRDMDAASLFAEANGAAVWFRLLRGLARIAGGDVSVEDRRVVLSLPRIDPRR